MASVPEKEQEKKQVSDRRKMLVKQVKAVQALLAKHGHESTHLFAKLKKKECWDYLQQPTDKGAMPETVEE